MQKDEGQRKWGELKRVELYPWQAEATEKWLSQKQGTIKVVTGVGKTLCALAIIDRLQETDPKLRVAVVVPTKVLVRQWRKELKKRLDLTPGEIGILGAGRSNSFDGEVKVLICVINSAAAKLPELVDAGTGEHLLLVVDECHRAGAPSFQRVFKTHRAYSLGLSATPERSESEENYSQTVLGHELGPIIYKMNYSEASRAGLLPDFEVRHYALPLSVEEAEEYQQLTRQIHDLRRKLKQQFGKREQKQFHGWVQRQANSEDSEVGAVAQRYLGLSIVRKHLLFKAEAREQAVQKILKSTFTINPEARVILFHETIEEVEEIYRQMQADGYRVVLEHSGLAPGERRQNIEAFRTGAARIIVSARTLIEGFNVPKADVGIVVASSASVRQRIQTIGRVLRKDEADKQAVVYVLYMHKTTDEAVYRRADWEEVVGADRNRYFFWDLQHLPVETNDPAPGVWNEYQ